MGRLMPPSLALLTLVMLAGLSLRPAHAQEETPTALPATSGPWEYPRIINSLTGLPYPDQAALERRNLLVKVSNYPPFVRPQSGLNQADLIFESESEGGATRLGAIFRSQVPERVGSVRSVRLLDLDLVQMYSALLAWSGASTPIRRMIIAAPWVSRAFSPLTNDNCLDAGFCRRAREGVPLEHTLYLEPARLYEKAESRGVNTGYKAHGLAFDPVPAFGGEPAHELELDWWGQTSARWEFDMRSGRWLRFTNGEAHFDELDGAQLWADNLIVLVAEHRRRPDLFAVGAPDESLEVDLQGLGAALLLRDGLFYRGTWRRQSRAETNALHITRRNSFTPLPLRPGRSWITIVRSMDMLRIREQPQDTVSA